jgi:hypothetical protein
MVLLKETDHTNKTRIHRSRFIYTVLTSLIVIIISILTIACGGPPKTLIKPGPTIRGLNLNGGYDCLQFGYMKLRHTGHQVRGTYEGVRKIGDNGIIVGKIEGDLVWIEWTQPGNIDKAMFPTKGKGWWRVSQKGARIDGKWGYDDSRDDGGKWIADRSEFSE